MWCAIIRGLVAAALTISASSAHSEWLKATSRHFNIYSDSSPEAIRLLATRLEQLDGSLRAISGIKDTDESAANPVTVYALDSLSSVNRLIGGQGVAGFYLGRAAGAVAFTPRRMIDSQLDPQTILFHEYAHHFLLQQSDIAYPAWLSEGYAEFASTARFSDEGVVIGAAAKHRAYALLGDTKLPIETLFAPGPKLNGMQLDQIYGRGWLLTHFLLLGDERRGQIAQYLQALNGGTPPLVAARTAFGDLKVLDRQLDAYLYRRRLTVATIGLARLPAIAVSVRPLTPGERTLIDMRIVSTRGVAAKEAASLYARASAKAASFPADATAQGWLAEMAHDADRNADAEAAADRALAVDPASMQALIYKAQARLARLAASHVPATDKRWGEARSWIIRANRLNTDAAEPLALFYDSFAAADTPPSKSAIQGLYRAQELAPQDDALRFRAARQYLTDGEAGLAKRMLRPLAFSPHASPNNGAARLIAMLEEGRTGPDAIRTFDAEVAAAAAQKEGG